MGKLRPQISRNWPKGHMAFLGKNESLDAKLYNSICHLFGKNLPGRVGQGRKVLWNYFNLVGLSLTAM
jgi:hypothetical protein